MGQYIISIPMVRLKAYKNNNQFKFKVNFNSYNFAIKSRVDIIKGDTTSVFQFLLVRLKVMNIGVNKKVLFQFLWYD